MVSDSGSFYSLSMRSGRILWGIARLYDPTKFSMFGSLLRVKDLLYLGLAAVPPTSTSYSSSSQGVVQKILCISLLKRALLRTASSTSTLAPSTSFSKELSLSADEQSLYVIGQKQKGPFTGYSSLCYSPQRFFTSNLSEVSSPSADCGFNIHMYYFNFDGQVRSGQVR